MSTRTPYPKYQDCPCGSGQKYKFCCFTKGFHFYTDNEGEVSRSVPLPKDLSPLLEQRSNMEEKLGRPVQSGDLVFPELANLSDEDIKKKMIGDFQKAGIRPELIYAFEKTGLLVTERNKHLIANIDLVAWNEAVEEYYTLHPEEDPRTT